MLYCIIFIVVYTLKSAVIVLNSFAVTIKLIAGGVSMLILKPVIATKLFITPFPLVIKPPPFYKMSVRTVSAAILIASSYAQMDDAPGDVIDEFENWCVVSSNCVVNPNENTGTDVQCVNGACTCMGAYEDPGASRGMAFRGWTCVRLGQPIPVLDMEYRITWESAAVDCVNRPATFDAALRAALIAYFTMTELDLSPAFCGSAHYVARGRTANGGRPGFADSFATNANNPFGAPTVIGQKTTLAAATCTPVSPVATMSLVGSLCQPLSCVTGYTLVNSGSVTVLSACVVNPPPGVVATLPPSVPVDPVVTTKDSDDGIPVGGLFGIAFGSALFVGLILLAVVYFTRSPAPETEVEQDNLQEEDSNNGPDKEQI